MSISTILRPFGSVVRLSVHYVSRPGAHVDYVAILGLAFETWLSALVAYKAFTNYRYYGLKSYVLWVLIRDSLIWFLLYVLSPFDRQNRVYDIHFVHRIAICLLWQALAWLVLPPGLLLMGIP